MTKEFGYIFIFVLLLFLIASGGVLIHYGNKIKNGEISNADREAGQFILSCGAIGLFINIISSIIYGYNISTDKAKNNQILYAIYIITIFFTAASNVILIIYGLKIYQNNICINTPNCQRTNCIDDYEIAKFIITLGSIYVVFGSLSMFYFIYKLISKNKKTQDNAEYTEQQSEEYTRLQQTNLMSPTSDFQQQPEPQLEPDPQSRPRLDPRLRRSKSIL
jgi:hypothetical protein